MPSKRPKPSPKRDVMQASSELDVLIIGAGPAGTACASHLNRAGLKVAILERSHFPRFAIGESLLPRTMELLDEADLLEPVQARDYIYKPGALFVRPDGEEAWIDFANQFTKGWTHAHQVPRDDFDLVLAEAVAARGVAIHYGHTVEEVESDAAPVVRGVDDSGARFELRPRFLVDASGFGRVLPRLLGLSRPSSQALRASLFAHLDGDRQPEGERAGAIWIGCDANAWIWMIPFSGGRTSVGVVAEPSFFDAFPTDPEDRLMAILARIPAIAARVEGSRCVFPPRFIAGYATDVRQLFGPGYVLIGNATEFVDPIFSSGVTVALETASLAAEAIIKQLDGQPPDWQREYSDPVHAAIAVYRGFVDCWYAGDLPEIFFTNPKPQRVVQQITSVLAGYVGDRDNPYVRDTVAELAKLTGQVRAFKQLQQLAKR